MTSITRRDEFVSGLGVEAYRVGGSVRDEILGRAPKDADYMARGVSLARLGDTLRLATGKRPKPLSDRQGQQFGWRTQPHGIEIALPRTEWNDGSGRRMGIRVDPNLTLEEDAKRRDFTFNALYRPLSENPCTELVVIDPTGTGISDLQRRIVRTTHPDSFRDDPLRMLRALRFVSTLDAEIAGDTWHQMLLHAHEADGLTHKGYASGTVFQEFSKLLMGQHPGGAMRLAAATVLPFVMPELEAMIGFEADSKYHDLPVDEHTWKALETAAAVDAPLRVRWALLFHDSGKPGSAWLGPDGRLHYYGKDGTEDHEVVSERLWREAAKRLNIPARFRDEVALLVRNHMVSLNHRVPRTWVARKRIALGDELLHDLLLHRVCDLNGKTAKVVQDHIRHIAMLEGTRKGQEIARVPSNVKDLAINGHDATAAGLDGRAIGDELRRVLDEVAVDPTPMKLTREWQLERLKA